MFQTSATVDLSRATLKDLVEDFVRLQLGYGEKEFAVSSEAGILYDPDETENLPKKLSELGIKPDSFLTITDEDDVDPFVNVVLNIENPHEEQPEKPIKALMEKLEIPKKPQQEPQTETKPSESNGVVVLDDESTSKRKRPLEEEAGSPEAKKKKLGTATAKGKGVLVVDDDGDGAILIDD